jgi:hypothetical protein
VRVRRQPAARGAGQVAVRIGGRWADHAAAPRQFRGIAGPGGDGAHPAGLTRSHTPGPARMRRTNSRAGASGSPAERASTRQQRSRSPPIGIGDGNGHGDSSIHRSRMPVTRKRGPRRADRSNSIGSPSFHRTWIGVGPRCRKGHPSGVMPHRRTGSRRSRAAQARPRRPRPPPRCRGGAPAARPLSRPPACSLPGEPYRAPVASRHRRFPRRSPGDHRIEPLFDPSSRPRPGRDVKSDEGPPQAVPTGHRRRRRRSLRGVMRR